MSFFTQNLYLNFRSFLGFLNGSCSSVKAIMLLSATLPLEIGLKCFWFPTALLLYLSLILKIFAYQVSFREDLGKSILSVDTYPDVK